MSIACLSFSKKSSPQKICLRQPTEAYLLRHPEVRSYVIYFKGVVMDNACDTLPHLLVESSVAL
jgi:hypothetical protein